MYHLTEDISDLMRLAVRVGLMVGVYALALRVVLALIRPTGNGNKMLGMAVGGVLALIAAQKYATVVPSDSDVFSLAVLLGGLVLNLMILNRVYEP